MYYFKEIDLPLNDPSIQPHYPIYKVIFHFVLTSLKIPTLPANRIAKVKKRRRQIKIIVVNLLNCNQGDKDVINIK